MRGTSQQEIQPTHHQQERGVHGGATARRRIGESGLPGKKLPWQLSTQPNAHERDQNKHDPTQSNLILSQSMPKPFQGLLRAGFMIILLGSE